MKELVLSTKIYGAYRNRLLSNFGADFKEKTHDLEVQVQDVGSDERGHLTSQASGADNEFLKNVLEMEYGQTYTFDEIEVGSEYTGQLIDVGHVGYGIYVDIGVIAPTFVDALLPLHRLRSQMNMERASVRDIADAFTLVEHLPVGVIINDKNPHERTLEATISNPTLQRLNSWLSDDHDRLLVFGSSLAMIHGALAQSGHQEDIYQIETLGRHEYCLVCKRTTNATGIITEIGPLLRGVPMHLFIPEEARSKRDDKT